MHLDRTTGSEPRHHRAGESRIQTRAVGVSRIAVAGTVQADLRCKREAAQQRRDLVQLPAADDLVRVGARVAHPALAFAEGQIVMGREARLVSGVQSRRSPIALQVVAVHDHLRCVRSLRYGQRRVLVQILGPGVSGPYLKPLRQSMIHIDLQRVVAGIAFRIPEESVGHEGAGTGSDGNILSPLSHVALERATTGVPPEVVPPAVQPAAFAQICAGMLLGSMLTNWWYPNDPTYATRRLVVP